MTTTVYKQKLEAIDVQDVELPSGAEILCAHEQGNDVCIWFRCDPTLPVEKRRLLVCGTGHIVPAQHDAKYIGTSFLAGGAFVFHVFETRK